MESFHCGICNIQFKSKRCLTAHQKSQRHKKHLTEENSHKHKCICGKSYLHRQSLFNHRKTCTYTPCEETVKEPDEDLASLKTEMEELKEELKQLKAEKSVTNNNNTTNNNTTNNNITINLNTHGKENIDYLSQTDLMKSVSRVFNSVPDLIWKIYFNPNHPENHNVIITDRRSPYINVFTKDKKWKLANKRATIGSMIDSSYMMLDETFENNKSEFSTTIQDGFKRFQDKFEKSEKKTMKEINKEVDMVIMNGPG